jgi:hypothetical protein
MKRLRALILMALLSVAAVGCDSPTGHTVVTESEILTMDRVYKSMFGPKDLDVVMLLSTDKPEVLWVKAIKAEIVGADGESPESPEYFCHSTFVNSQSQPVRSQKILGPTLGRTQMMFTLVQGMTEVRFPEGFAMPVLSNDSFNNYVMVMNPTERDEPIRVGVDSRIEYARDSELEERMKPLFLLALVTKVPLEGQDGDHASHDHGGEHSCLSAGADVMAAASVDRAGRKFVPISKSESGVEQTGHWYVPPGRHVYRHRLEPMTESIPYDAKAHYIFAHLHPFGESLELIDLTTGESVFKAFANNYPDQVAVEKITKYSSTEGIPILRDHDYEIVAVYNNTTDQDVDSMAVMYLYLHDANWNIPQRKRST